MLVLHANRELEHTFNKLIETMGAKIAWNGRFVVIGDQLILEGKVRSLFFQFETKKVLTNLIDLTISPEQVVEISKHPKLQDLVNMTLYVFGKWGVLKGLKVEHDYAHLNQLFKKILHIYYIEPAFQSDHFRFYKEGKRITYEDVIETVLQSEKQPEEGSEEEWEKEAQGLWHKVVWKNRQRAFQKVDTTLVERVTDRLGNNFYMVGYQCPKCSEKLHMAVYPVGNEQRIETEEKGVYVARVYTCSQCNCFYTPRPERLLAEGLVYEMSFGDDKKAYEDYLELMGKEGRRTSNFKCNEYEAVRNRRLQGGAQAQGGAPQDGGEDDAQDAPQDEADALRQMESYSRKAEYLPDDVFQRFAYRVEDGFYPDAAVKKNETKILKQVKLRRENEERRRRRKAEENGAGAGDARTADAGRPNGPAPAGNRASRGVARRQAGNLDGGFGRDGFARNASSSDGGGSYSGKGLDGNASRGHEYGSSVPAGRGRTNSDRDSDRDAGDSTGKYPGSFAGDSDGMEFGGSPMPDMQAGFGPGGPQRFSPRNGADGTGAKQYEKYYARLGVLERMSARQRAEFRKQVEADASLDAQAKQEFLRPIEEAEFKERADAIARKVDGSENRSYAQIHKVLQEVEQAQLPDAQKQPFLERLRSLLKRRGEQEVRQIMEQAPKQLDREGYQKLRRRLDVYEGVDLSPYEEQLQQKREEAEKREIAVMVKRSPKRGRGDYVSLMSRLEKQGFAKEMLAPYMEKIKGRLREIDEARVDKISGNAASMDFNAAADAYEQIMQENFLPDIKENALEILSRRLEKIKTDECQLLVQKLQQEMQGVIKENARHHFYPARKVMLKKAEPGETHIFDRAAAVYAGGKNLFEYPIFAVDTSRNRSGKDGMLLTPENLFYHTRMNSYAIPVSAVDSLSATTGLMNHKLILEEKNGAKHKLPFAVSGSEIKDWAQVLGDFIQYLQEKPASRKLEYLAKDRHDKICCFRCGYVYQNGDVCPECGYKMNQ